MVNISIAEDDWAHFLMVEEAIFQTLPHYHITHSRSGNELLQTLADSVLPDMILLDLNLPQKNGLACLIEIRKKKAFRNVPVVIYSTSSDFEDIDRCYKNGCSLYLVKPPSFKALVAQIKKLFLHEFTEEAVSKSNQLFRAIQVSSSQAYRISADWTEMHLLAGKNFIADSKPFRNWLEKNILYEDHPAFEFAIKHAVKNKRILEIELRIIKEDESMGWTFFRAVPILDDHGNVKEWFGAGNDITDRKIAEQEIKSEHSFLERVTDNTPHLIYVYDLDEQRFIYVNRRIREMAGIEQDYVYSMGPHLFKVILHPDDFNRRMDYFNHLSTLKPDETRENEFRIKVFDEYRWFRSKDRIFTIENKIVKQVIGLAEDVSYEKRVLESLSEETGGIRMN